MKSLILIFAFRAKLSVTTIYCLILGLFSQNSFSQPITIVKKNLPLASIIIPEKASGQIRNSAKTLQAIIFQSTRARLPIKTLNNTGSTAIHIGNTNYVKKLNIDLSAVDDDGFVLWGVYPFNLVILGGSDWGTEFGVNYFLENYLGVVSLFPTDAGMNIPQISDIEVQIDKQIENPVYLSRQFAPGTTSNKNELGKWERFNRLRGRIKFHHNLTKLFDPEEYYQSNPEFYADYVTQKPEGVRWQPNFSAPGIVDSASSKIIRFFENNPKANSYSLGVNDVKKYDESPSSLKRRNGKKNYLGLEDISDDYYLWANSVVKKVKIVFPNKQFGLLASNNVATPPSENIEMDSSIVPFLTYERLRWSDTIQEKQGQSLTIQWAKRSPQLGWYDYAYGLNYLVPRVWFHEMKDYLQWGTQHQVLYYFSEVYPNWGEGPKSWVHTKLLWNPFYDVDSLLNIWYVSAVGDQAAPKLKAFYTIWEQFWTKDILQTKWKETSRQYLPKDDLTYLDAVPKEYIQQSDYLLDQAFLLAETVPQKLRIQKILEMWQIYKTAVQIWQQSLGASDKERVRMLKADSSFLALLENLQNDSLHSESIRIIKSTLLIN